LAKILKEVWIGTYEELVDPNFTKTKLPQTILLVGGPLFKPDGTQINGEAENGVKITFTNVNELPTTPGPSLIGSLVGKRNGSGILKTAFHEFTHIMTQTKRFSDQFPQISRTNYMEDDWNATGTGTNTDTIALQAGFISKYARKSANEDFAELLSIYVTRGEANWKACLKSSVFLVEVVPAVAKTDTTEFAPAVILPDSSSYKMINLKLGYVRDYLQTEWKIDLDDFRAVFERRVQNLNEVLNKK
jgi:substrate import-associated zinc metallohydrolase lipoprotein